MRVVIVFLVLVSAVPALAETKFYHCKDQWGQPVFSERPCGADAAAGSVEGPPASGSAAPEDMSKVSADNALRAGERKVDYLEDRIARYQRERDARVAELRRRGTYANNNLAGAQYQQSLATEMQSVTAQYQSKIDADRDEIQRLTERMKDVSQGASE